MPYLILHRNHLLNQNEVTQSEGFYEKKYFIGFPKKTKRWKNETFLLQIEATEKLAKYDKQVWFDQVSISQILFIMKLLFKATPFHQYMYSLFL